MKSFDPAQQTERENYKFLTGTIIPRPIAFVTSCSEGIMNAAPFSYFNIVSANPPMISVSVQRTKGQQKDTARNIAATKEFVVHIVDEDNVEQVNRTAASLPFEENEVELAGMTLVNSTKITVPGVHEAKVRFECVLERIVEFENTDLIIGRVVQFHIEEDLLTDGRTDPKKLGAVSRLAGSTYAKLGELFNIERPK